MLINRDRLESIALVGENYNLCGILHDRINKSNSPQVHCDRVLQWIML